MNSDEPYLPEFRAEGDHDREPAIGQNVANGRRRRWLRRLLLDIALMAVLVVTFYGLLTSGLLADFAGSFGQQPFAQPGGSPSP